MRRSLAALALLVTSGLPAVGHAYICMRVSESNGLEPQCSPPSPDPFGPSLSWNIRTIPFTLHAQGTNDIVGTDELDTLRDAFTRWEAATECVAPNRTTNLLFAETASLSNRDLIGFNFLDENSNENLLIFRDNEWPRSGRAALIIALTTTTFNALTGEIFDADIEFNSARFNFTIGDTNPDTDLLNTAVHEIGHFVGIGHSTSNFCGVCGSPGSDTNLDLRPTMCAEAQPTETCKRSLACDDLDAAVFKYPSGMPNGFCSPPTDVCGCCAPPRALTAIPTVAVTDVDDGLGGCAQVPAMPIAVAFAAVLLGRIRRRRAP